MNNQRSELSGRNKYWIPKFRYLELKNFCLQYPDWKIVLASIDPLKSHFSKISSGKISDPTNDLAIRRLEIMNNISLVETCASLADPSIASFLIKGITENYSYDYLKYQLGLPAGRDYYYDRYRKFFWILDKKRERPL